jgi:hypothetical protein
MSHFDTIEIDPIQMTARVGPCALGQALNEEASQHGLCFPTGHCVGVPVGGFLLGGGLGWFIPHYGYSAESIESVTIVDASGNVVVVDSSKACQEEEEASSSAADDDDWMWLVRGAASAFPGVVVSFTLRLHPLPPVIKSRLELYPLESFEPMAKFFHEHVEAHPELSSKLEMTLVMASTPPPLANVVKVSKLLMVMVVGIANSEEEFQGIVKPLQEETPVAPFFPSDFVDHDSFHSLPELLREAFPPGTHWVNRCLLGGPDQFTKVDWTKFRTTFEAEAPSGPSHGMAVIAPQNPVTVPGCYGPVRPGLAVLIVGAYHCAEEGDKDGPSEKQQALQFVSAMEEVAEPAAVRYGALEHPVNRHTFGKVFGDCADRLNAVRAKLDPGKLFFDPSTAEPSH